MRSLKRIWAWIWYNGFLIACGAILLALGLAGPSKKHSNNNPVAATKAVPHVSQRYISLDHSSENENEDDGEGDRTSDGTRSATVHYYNRNTGYSADYDLDVEVEDGEVTTIYWPNGGESGLDDDPDKEYEIDVDEEDE